MLSTATALIEAVNDAIMEDESMDLARILCHTHKEMDRDEFAKAIYFYSGIIASATADKVTKILLNESQMKELVSSIDEMEQLRNEVLSGE